MLMNSGSRITRKPLVNKIGGSDGPIIRVRLLLTAANFLQAMARCPIDQSHRLVIVTSGRVQFARHARGPQSRTFRQLRG